MEEQTRNGKFFILTKLKRLQQKVLMKNLDSTSTDLSTLFHNFHLTELLKCSVEQMLFLRDGERMLKTSNSGLMRRPRPLKITIGRTSALKSKETVDQTILELHDPLPQDGGNCSKKMEISS
jgi:hypothetical protein